MRAARYKHELFTKSVFLVNLQRKKNNFKLDKKEFKFIGHKIVFISKYHLN